jgi:hypothetical protein
MLYAIDTNIATFVEMPLPAEHYNAYNAPFLYITQHKQARRVAIMSLSAFARFAQEVDSIITTASSPTNAYIFLQIGTPKGQLMMISNTGRSGTTLLSQMLHVDEQSVSFAEPDVFVCLSKMLAESRRNKKDNR